MENHANLVKTTTPALVEEKQDSNAKNTETGNKKEAPLTLLKGTLSFNKDKRQHKFSGMWKYENSTTYAPQRFELVRNLGIGEEATNLATDGVFHGSFSVIFTQTNSKGKIKEKSTVITERDVHIKFTPSNKTPQISYNIAGRGSNRFGTFQLTGHCGPSQYSEEEMQVELYKKYIPILPPPTPVTNDTVVLRGKLYKTSITTDYGVKEAVWKVEGQWSSSLKYLTMNKNEKLINPFEYSHSASDRRLGDGLPFEPEGGRYVGWFLLNNDNGSKSKIQEKDVTLKFRKNSENDWNVEGKGSNAFGKYTITGTLSHTDHQLTIFRHFSRVSKPPRKSTPEVANLAQNEVVPKLKLEDVVCCEKNEIVDVLKPPDAGTYAAISRGILRHNTTQNSITCSGKWALTKEHFNSNITSNFGFGCDDVSNDANFPVDGAGYRGNFKLKRGATKYQQITDQQICFKFRKNRGGSYNVYGKGVNSLGEFSLQGILIVSGKNSGNLELYRSYTPNTAAQKTQPKTPKPTATATTTTTTTTQRGRATKLPAKLADDNRLAVVLRELLEMDLQQWFSFPVDPVALNVPGYFNIIPNPMDLTTIQTKIASGDLPEQEFCRLVRLVYQNAMQFNENPTHPVHSAANLALEYFDKKFPNKKRKKANLADVPGVEYEKLWGAFCDVRVMFTKMKEQLTQRNVDTSSYKFPTEVTNYLTVPAMTTTTTDSRAPPEPKKAKKAPIVVQTPEPIPLTLKEQQQLTNAINEMSEDKLLGVINIIKEHQANLANPSDSDEDSDEIDLEIDALSVTTQRKLWQFVMKHAKKPKKKKPKKSTTFSPEKAEESISPEKSAAAKEEDDFGDFGDFEEDDPEVSLSDSADVSNAWDTIHATANSNANLTTNAANAAAADDAWDLARSEAQKRNKMELEKKAREAKILADAASLSEKRRKEAKDLADRALAAKRKDAHHLAELKRAEKLRLEGEADAARKRARKEREGVQQVVDFDEQRVLVSQYEYQDTNHNSGDGGGGGASPSSDFGF